jgi:hypothetical protein
MTRALFRLGLRRPLKHTLTPSSTESCLQVGIAGELYPSLGIFLTSPFKKKYLILKSDAMAKNVFHLYL